MQSDYMIDMQVGTPTEWVTPPTKALLPDGLSPAKRTLIRYLQVVLKETRLRLKPLGGVLSPDAYRIAKRKIRRPLRLQNRRKIRRLLGRPIHVWL